jgi:hypothetical protein
VIEKAVLRNRLFFDRWNAAFLEKYSPPDRNILDTGWARLYIWTKREHTNGFPAIPANFERRVFSARHARDALFEGPKVENKWW